jgi:hypothetical protein
MMRVAPRADDAACRGGTDCESGSRDFDLAMCTEWPIYIQRQRRLASVRFVLTSMCRDRRPEHDVEVIVADERLVQPRVPATPPQLAAAAVDRNTIGSAH